MKLLIGALLFCGGMAMADEVTDMNTPDRDPAAVTATSGSHRTYPGGVDQEDLQVQAKLPEAAVKTDYRTVQRGVYKTLYNQELKDERTEPVEE